MDTFQNPSAMNAGASVLQGAQEGRQIAEQRSQRQFENSLKLQENVNNTVRVSIDSLKNQVEAARYGIDPQAIKNFGLSAQAQKQMEHMNETFQQSNMVPQGNQPLAPEGISAEGLGGVYTERAQQGDVTKRALDVEAVQQKGAAERQGEQLGAEGVWKEQAETAQWNRSQAQLKNSMDIAKYNAGKALERFKEARLYKNTEDEKIQKRQISNELIGANKELVKLQSGEKKYIDNAIEAAKTKVPFRPLGDNDIKKLKLQYQSEVLTPYVEHIKVLRTIASDIGLWPSEKKKITGDDLKSQVNPPAPSLDSTAPNIYDNPDNIQQGPTLSVYGSEPVGPGNMPPEMAQQEAIKKLVDQNKQVQKQNEVKKYDPVAVESVYRKFMNGETEIKPGPNEAPRPNKLDWIVKRLDEKVARGQLTKEQAFKIQNNLSNELLHRVGKM